ncbi:hypothetical protein [Novosphingobium sp. P6W]|uniref:hypothetical protein n=1 Tax=Novosphingobium sp. P6W TaxID=1609758 RepID=UPI000A983595|nr:hypothetical protein [Novosphingobium sp. P6W]
MHTTIMGGSDRPKTNAFIPSAFACDMALPASMRKSGPGLLTREDLRHLVAAMVD